MTTKQNNTIVKRGDVVEGAYKAPGRDVIESVELVVSGAYLDPVSRREMLFGIRRDKRAAGAVVTMNPKSFIDEGRTITTAPKGEALLTLGDYVLRADRNHFAYVEKIGGKSELQRKLALESGTLLDDKTVFLEEVDLAVQEE